MRLYTAEEAAEVLRLSKWTVWKYGREGKLKTVRFGRTVRYDLDDKGGNYEDGNCMGDSRSRMVRLRFHGDGNDYDDVGGKQWESMK